MSAPRALALAPTPQVAASHHHMGGLARITTPAPSMSAQGRAMETSVNAHS